MNSNYAVDPIQMRFLIENCKEPLRFKNYIGCNVMEWSLEKWKAILKDEIMEFRCGVSKYTKNPQWERTTKIEHMKFDDFLTTMETNSKKWLYFDYKYLKDWLSNVEELKNEISWEAFGFPELNFEHSTLWIGSKGAHTPCHKDTYGSNIIFQIFGQKEWIIFPPEENLQQTRIPYEESSIYSKLNFYSPNPKDFKALSRCRKITLNPGDVLFLPNKWWHYVENLETSISLNTWISMEVDHEERINESLIQLIISQFSKDLNKDQQKILLNPNIQDEIQNLNFATAIETVNFCKEKFMEEQKNKKFKSEQNENAKPQNFLSVDKILDENVFIEKVNVMSNEEFHQYIENKSKNFKIDTNFDDNEIRNNCIEKTIDAFTDPDVISLVKQKLLNS
ncbi:unnamed protein product [Brassicogethes aeneus]|uniref:JmjC domain-containing protein n=1 Tax=Brassicogethes aeneus TaxID=1431903 RepID=A0A9P0AX76_BRAAE|nr:unnamed protein product [Brassicogethes aeneus]